MSEKSENITNQSISTEIKSFSDLSSQNTRSLFQNDRSCNLNEISPFRSMIIDQIQFIQNEKAILSTFNEVRFLIFNLKFCLKFCLIISVIAQF